MAPRGGYVPRPNARDGWWGMALRESGIPRVTPHELCHTAASFAVQSGANVKGGSVGAWVCVGCDDSGCVR